MLAALLHRTLLIANSHGFFPIWPAVVPYWPCKWAITPIREKIDENRSPQITNHRNANSDNIKNQPISSVQRRYRVMNF